MRRRRLAIAGVFTLVGAMALTPPASALTRGRRPAATGLEVYVGTVDGTDLDQLREAGVDLGHDVGGQTPRATPGSRRC